MQLSISATVVLTVVVVLLIRKGGLKPSHAIASVLLGFYLAGTSLAPTIRNATTSVAQMLSSISF
ncbi:hypothetical protein [Streptomyces sp. TR02-1]|uniref:hypothetical protein n=1 Tax=Streptomyces sp. TR02-1 TaxID=3385977 RepID=UPI0039A19DC6